MFADISRAKSLTRAALIAAAYTALTLVSAMLGLSSGAVQVRLGEALCVLPALTPGAIPGLALGCFLSNILTGGLPWDILFGTLATLLGAAGTYALRKHPVLLLFPPVAANTLIVPFVLRWAYHLEGSWWLLALGVFAGETVACVLLGSLLYRKLKKMPGLFQ